MTPERINTVIAEWCGWKRKPDQEYVDIESRAVYVIPDVMPNYYGDLNAIHEAESKTYGDCHWLYVEKLIRVTKCDVEVIGDEWCLIHATAPQRCEALLRTIGKWEEST